MQPDAFHDRLDAVRRRFASSLEYKIKDTLAELPNLTGDGEAVVDAVAVSYRRIHGICGVGAAVGFAVTGRAAKDVEDVLIDAFRARRGLESDEVAHLKATLDALSAAAEAELRSVSTPATSKNEE